MIKKFKYEIFSFIFILIFGVILHFSYEWSNNNLFVGSFSSVNESVWEHLKLIYFPTLITIIIGSIYNHENYTNYLSAKTKGLLSSLVFTVVFFYTYTGILGYNIAFIDISSFFIAVLIGEFVSIKNMIYKTKDNFTTSIIILIFLFLSFIIFTYFPPKIGLFKDPITNTYGIFQFKSTIKL